MCVSNTWPSITSVKFRDALTVGCGTSTGQILLYDIRCAQPLLVKDHNFDLPIRSIEFHHDQELVLSQDQRILKIWNWNTVRNIIIVVDYYLYKMILCM